MHTNRPNYWLLTAVLASAAAAACAGGAAEAEPAAGEAARVVPVRTAAVQTRDLTQTLDLTGTLDPRAEVNVVAEVSARLERTLRNEGDRVRPGDLLATLDEVDFRLARDRAKAAVDVAEANRAHAAAEKTRADSLLKTGGITDKDRLAAEVAVQVADASAAQARSELAIAERQLARTRITAPIAGRIAARRADAGAMLQAGAPVYTIVDDAVFELRASVASGDFGRLEVGAPVAVTVDALPGFAADGRVDRIAPQVDPRSRSFEVIINVPGRPELVSGLFARAEVQVGTAPGSLVVPPAALVRDGADPSRAQTFVVAGGKAERRDVTVGIEAADAVQVISGLNAGDEVVLDPPSALGPGTPVQVGDATARGGASGSGSGGRGAKAGS
ncbi:MAG: efflux RND transporter periplasmic adaptor subunit [Acidobacteria bacterium]|nr:efflux RND transporter periplasmic adaptor subunit [Acidobacteriota bacterium]